MRLKREKLGFKVCFHKVNLYRYNSDSLRRIKEEQKNKMLEQLHLAVENGDKFISMVSHELRTPIHGGAVHV